MKSPRNKNYGVPNVVLFLTMMASGTAGAALLDFLKSPSELIMNQKNCTFMKQNSGGIAGEILNGRFIFSPAAGVVVVMMSMEKLDDNRVLARMEQSENRQLVVLDVKKGKGTVTATLAPGAPLFLECTL